jgi:hypothetical protein
VVPQACDCIAIASAVGYALAEYRSQRNDPSEVPVPEDNSKVRPARLPRPRPNSEFSEGRKGTFLIDHVGPVQVNPADFMPVETQPAASTDKSSGSDKQ